MITGYHLATLNALINIAACACVLFGVRAIRRREFETHRRCMLVALVLSGLFLASYLTRMYLFGDQRYSGTGFGRHAYLALLASHVLMSLVVAPAVVYTVVLGLRDQRERHRRIARKVLPAWLYVLATGVLVYLTLYHFTG